jgi:hypothetical protein
MSSDIDKVVQRVSGFMLVPLFEEMDGPELCITFVEYINIGLKGPRRRKKTFIRTMWTRESLHSRVDLCPFHEDLFKESYRLVSPVNLTSSVVMIWSKYNVP